MVKTIRNIILLTTFFFLHSCTKDVDFNQIDDASVNATYLLTLMHFNLTAPDFLDDFNEEIRITTDEVLTPITSSSETYLERIELTILTENTFNREFTIDFVFFNENDQPIYTLQPTIVIPANSSELTTIIEIPQSDIQVIYNTAYIRSFITLLPDVSGNTININDTSFLNLKSSLTLFFNYRKV